MSQKAADLDEKMRETLVKLDEMKGLILCCVYVLVKVTAVKSGQAGSFSKSKKLFVFLF